LLALGPWLLGAPIFWWGGKSAMADDDGCSFG